MDKLAEIMDWKRSEVAERERPVSESELRQLSQRFDRGISFYDALANPEELSVVRKCENLPPLVRLQRKSPAMEQARTYYNGNADALSVLTDENFGGKLKIFGKQTIF